MNEKKSSLQDTFLNALSKERTLVAIYLANGVRLIGKIESFDAYVVLLKAGGLNQLVYKHSIATMVPSAAVVLKEESTQASGSNDQQSAKSTPTITRKRSRSLA